MRNRYADAVDWIDQALNLPGADAHPALRVRALCTKARCLWQLGRGAEQPAVIAEAEAIARRLGDPVILSQVLQSRVQHEIRCRAARRRGRPRRRGARLGQRRPATTGRSPKRPAERRSRRPRIADLRERVDRAAVAAQRGRQRPSSSRACSAPPPTPRSASAASATPADFAARATPIARALDNPFARMIYSGNLGLAALLTGETDTASRRVPRGARALPRDGRPARGVRRPPRPGRRRRGARRRRRAPRRSSAPPTRTATTSPEDPVEARLDEAFFEPARTRYGTDAWDAAAREGGALSFDDAIAYALEEPLPSRGDASG